MSCRPSVRFITGGSTETGLDVLASVAVVLPVHREGEYVGAVVGEANAAALFPSLEVASPGLEGISGLTQPEGHILYHTDTKDRWDPLLGEAVLADHVGEDLARTLVAGDTAGATRGA